MCGVGITVPPHGSVVRMEQVGFSQLPSQLCPPTTLGRRGPPDESQTGAALTRMGVSMEYH